MVSAVTPQGTVAYTYNAEGLRVSQSLGGVVTEYTWDWATPVPELLSDGDALYLVGHDTLGWTAGAGWTYALPDALGSVRQEVDAAGALLDARAWSPYGVEQGEAQSGLGYTGEWFDAVVGLEYLRARWYDAGVGRFTSRDPWEGDLLRPISLLSYPYASADPVNRKDPSGAIDELVWKLAMTGYVPGSGMWCSSNYDYQPFERLNIYLGHTEVDQVYNLNRGETVQKWNTADTEMLRALNRAVLGMESLIGPAFGQRMGDGLGNKVVVAYDPPGHPSGKLSYIYHGGWAGIKVGKNRLQSKTYSGTFMRTAQQPNNPEDRMTAGFAHELTHLVLHIVNRAPPDEAQPIYVEYCNKVGGFVAENGVWVWYPVSNISSDGTMSVRCGECDPQVGCTNATLANPWEGLANSVGMYIAAPTIYDTPLRVSLGSRSRWKNIDLSHVRDFIENDFVAYVQ